MATQILPLHERFNIMRRDDWLSNIKYDWASFTQMFQDPSSIMHNDDPGLDALTKLALATLLSMVFLALAISFLTVLCKGGHRLCRLMSPKWQQWRQTRTAASVDDDLELALVPVASAQPSIEASSLASLESCLRPLPVYSAKPGQDDLELPMYMPQLRGGSTFPLSSSALHQNCREIAVRQFGAFGWNGPSEWEIEEERRRSLAAAEARQMGARAAEREVEAAAQRLVDAQIRVQNQRNAMGWRDTTRRSK